MIALDHCMVRHGLLLLLARGRCQVDDIKEMLRRPNLITRKLVSDADVRRLCTGLRASLDQKPVATSFVVQSLLQSEYFTSFLTHTTTTIDPVEIALLECNSP